VTSSVPLKPKLGLVLVSGAGGVVSGTTATPLGSRP
jgi:hypothetical protein